jgi:predicted nucleic acid-binding protein
LGSIGESLGRKVYLDTNSFIYFLEESEPWVGAAKGLAEALDRGECAAVTSELSLAECLVKPMELERSDVIATYLDFLRDRRSFSIVPVTRDLLIEAARLRALSRIKLPDAIHAATALRSGCISFLTNDDRLSIPGIRMIRWRELGALPEE